MKTVFAALEFHLKNTKSSNFFIDILKQYFDDFTVISVNDAWYKIPQLKPDILIIWQHLFSPQELESFGVKNTVLIPMYDACPHTQEFWLQYKKYKIFCFSNIHYRSLKEWGFTTYYSQYYPENVSTECRIHKGLCVFFWQRSAAINWELVKILLGDTHVTAFHYHIATNISDNYILPDQADIEKYSIQFSNWFEDNNEYIRHLQEADIFFAPRESEGIGLSFIEALKEGCCVIAPDRPTMNEYIRNEENGLLYDPEKPEPIILDNILQIRQNALTSAKKQAQIWKNSIPDIISFIKQQEGQFLRKKHIIIIVKKKIRAKIRYWYKKIQEKKPVFIKLYAGLGNQLFQLSYGKYLEASGKKVIFILNRTGGHSKQYDLPEIIKTQEHIIMPGTAFSLFIYKFITKYIMRSFYTGFYQEYRYADYITTNGAFSFLKDGEYKKSSIYKQIIDSVSVSIHIRGGDYLTGDCPTRYGNICTASYYQKAIEYIAAKITNPVIYIFTNDIEYAKNMIPDCGIETVYVHDDEHLEDPGFDLFLMSSCKHNIIANSTYSWWSAFLNDNSSKMVISPAKWINDPSFILSNLIPHTWIKL